MAGRPPKEKSFANMLRIAVNEAVKKGGKTTNLRAVADALVKRAMAGDVQAIKEIADRLDGKPAQEVQGQLDTNIVVQLVRFGDNDSASEQLDAEALPAPRVALS